MQGDASRTDPSVWLIDWFAQRSGGTRLETEEAKRANYFELGLISSIEIIEFVCDIEDHFGVRFSENAFQDRRFSTVSGLAEILEEMLSATVPTER